jgi:hypothetical protein
MDWLLLLRLVDLVLIGLSVGFTLALYFHFGTLSQSRYLQRARTLYLVAYVSLAAAAMAEIEIAITTDRPATWRTVLVTVAALASSSANVWCWLNWQYVQREMKAGAR